MASVALTGYILANAISDALAIFKTEFNATPIKPEHIVRAIAADAGDQPERA